MHSVIQMYRQTPPGRLCQRILDWGEDELPAWFQSEVVDTDGGLDVILAADVVYTEEDLEDDEMAKKLLKTLNLLFTHGAVSICVAL